MMSRKPSLSILLQIICGIILVSLVTLPSCSGETNRAVSACFNSTEKSLQINCGTGYMLSIKRAFYGYSNSKSCSYRPGDCIQTEHEAYPCVGRDKCTINLPSGNYGQLIPSCNEYSQYFQVEYTCVPVVRMRNICQVRNLTAQSGYIVSPFYPYNYRANQDCLTTIRVHSSQTINLMIIDMDLEINGTYGCHDWMYAYNQQRSVTLCGRRGNEKLTTLQSNELSINFHSNHQKNKKGFWLYYEAVPPLPTTTVTMTTETLPETTSKGSGVTHKPKTTIPVTKITQDQPKSDDKLPFAAIVGGVIGTLTLILIILLILLAVKWWKERQHSYKRSPKDIEYLDARNPAFRSSTGNDFQGVEIYYNC